MIKTLRFLKRIVVASFFVYGYNLLAQSINLIIPLNVATVSYVTVFGVGGLLSLILIYIMCF